MTRFFQLAVLVVSCAASRLLPAQARSASPSPAQLITRAVSALGGPAALDSVRNKTVEFNAVTFAQGQEETPGSPARHLRTGVPLSTTMERASQPVRISAS